ncbi:MAG: hypothetical protein Q8L48_32895 [Archangium sp.]|nr:hypothetical protein [Archangium sp.]
MATNVPFATHASSSKSNLERDLLGAVLAGQVAGLIMAVAMVAVFTLFLGAAWYHPVQVIGSFALGDAALPGSFFLPAFLAGLAIHQLVATLAWSLGFGLLINKVPRTFVNVLALGLATGVASQVFDAALFVPAIMNRFHGHNIWAENVPAAWSWLAHVVFGLGFLVFLPIRQALRRVHVRTVSERAS